MSALVLSRFRWLLAVGLVLALSLVLPPQAVDATAGNSTLNCIPAGDDLICQASDPDGMKKIRVIDPATGMTVQKFKPKGSQGPFTFRIPKGNWRIQITDGQSPPTRDVWQVDPDGRTRFIGSV